MPIHSTVHVTDPEGDFSWVEKNIQKAKEAGIEIAIDAHGHLALGPDVSYVCGGDLLGVGPDNLKLLAFFERAKVDYPHQVVKIAGNRDIIMTRLYQELSDLEFIRAMIEDTSEPRWIAPAKRSTFKKYCEELKLDAAAEDTTLQVAYLKWAFQHTMGSQGLFEHLKAEFKVDDDALVIQQLLAPNFKKAIFDHLKTSVSMQIIDQVLYSHGALTENAFNYYNLDIHNTPATTFIDLANQRYLKDIEKSEQGAYDRPGTYVPGQAEQKIARGQLNHDALPNDFVGHGSIVTASYEDAKGNPALPSQAVIDYLATNNISAIVIGHKPFGDKPTFLQGFSGEKAVQFILADSRYYRNAQTAQVIYFQQDTTTASLQGHMQVCDQKNQQWTADYPALKVAQPPSNLLTSWIAVVWSWITRFFPSLAQPIPPSAPQEPTSYGPVMDGDAVRFVVGRNRDNPDVYAAYYKDGFKQIDVTYTGEQLQAMQAIVLLEAAQNPLHTQFDANKMAAMAPPQTQQRVEQTSKAHPSI